MINKQNSIWCSAIIIVALIVMSDVSAFAGEGTKKRLKFNNASIPKKLVLTGDARIDTNKNRKTSGSGGSLRIGPGGKAVWRFADKANSGKVEMWIYEDMKVPGNIKRGGRGALWGVIQEDTPVLLAGAVYAKFLTGDTSYASADFIPGKEKPWHHVKWLKSKRKEGWHKWTFDLDPKKGLLLFIDDKPITNFNDKNFWNKTRLQGVNGIMLLGDATDSGQILWVDDVTVVLGPVMKVKPGSASANTKSTSGSGKTVSTTPPPTDLKVTYTPLRKWKSAPYKKWKRGPGKDSSYFPIGVWLQNPKNAKKYKAAGFNLYVGLHKGPTEKQLAKLAEAGMPVICEQNEVGLKNINNPIIVGWESGSEPDNAKSFKKYWKNKERLKEGWPEFYKSKKLDKKPYKGKYGPPIPPKWIVKRYKEVKNNDPSRPARLGLGQGVAWNGWYGRGSRTGKLEDYPEYLKGCDIGCFDIYPNVDPGVIQGNLWYQALGINRLRKWTNYDKPTWNCIGPTVINHPEIKPTPAEVKADVWMSIIYGSRGILYFVHQFKPKFRESALLADPTMLAAVTAINKQVTQLAPIINSRPIPDALSVKSSKNETPVHAVLKKYKGYTYIFAVGMNSKPTKAKFKIEKSATNAALEVIGENRTIQIKGGVFEDDFQGYAVHLYKLKE